MKAQFTETESCGPPQLFEAEIPSRAWGLDRLSAAVVEVYQRLLHDERFLTPQYWRLGRLLALARGEFQRGQWGAYLHELGIDKTRVAKAMRIYETFSSEQTTAELTVAEAYDRRPRKPRKVRSKRRAKSDVPSPALSSPSWPQFSRVIIDAVERQLGDAEFWTAGEIAVALIEVERATSTLRELKRRLQHFDSDRRTADGLRS